MPDPIPYAPGYDFTASDKGPQLNVELANVAEATEGLVSAVADIRRADGALKNGIVTADSLAVSALLELSPEAIAALDLAEAVTRAEDAEDAAAASAAAAEGSATTATTQAGLASASAAAAAAPRVAFMAHRNSVDQAGIAVDTATKLVANSEVFDQGGFYDTTLARWTPSAGRYRISAAAFFSAAVVSGQQYQAMIYKNGSLFRRSVVSASGNAGLTVAVSAVDAANGTDFYEFFVRGAGAGTKTVSGDPANTWFEGSAL